LSEERVRQAATAPSPEYFAAFQQGLYSRQAITLIVEIAALTDGRIVAHRITCALSGTDRASE
jgi:hypothetical protein